MPVTQFGFNHKDGRRFLWTYDNCSLETYTGSEGDLGINLERLTDNPNDFIKEICTRSYQYEREAEDLTDLIFDFIPEMTDEQLEILKGIAKRNDWLDDLLEHLGEE